MKISIKGKCFDTENAILIGEHDSGLPENSDSYWIAGLYKTNDTSDYFLAGEGGFMTRFGNNLQFDFMGIDTIKKLKGSKIIPFSRNQAFAWAKRHLLPEITEKEFKAYINEHLGNIDYVVAENEAIISASLSDNEGESRVLVFTEAQDQQVTISLSKKEWDDFKQKVESIFDGK